MKCCSQCVGLTIAVACSVYLSDLASAQVFPDNGESGVSVRKSLVNGTVSGNEGLSDDGEPNYPRSKSPSLGLSHSYEVYPPYEPKAHKEPPSLPFTGRYQNSCLGQILILENPNEIFVYVNGRTARAKDANELMRMYPDAYRLYDRTLGKDKRLFLARYAAWKEGHSDASRLYGAKDGLPGGQFNTNTSQDLSITVMENGKKVSITGNNTAMTVSVNGKAVRANRVAQVKKKFPDAFRMFEEQLAAANENDGQS